MSANDSGDLIVCIAQVFMHTTRMLHPQGCIPSPILTALPDRGSSHGLCPGSVRALGNLCTIQVGGRCRVKRRCSRAARTEVPAHDNTEKLVHCSSLTEGAQLCNLKLQLCGKQVSWSSWSHRDPGLCVLHVSGWQTHPWPCLMCSIPLRTLPCALDSTVLDGGGGKRWQQHVARGLRGSTCLCRCHTGVALHTAAGSLKAGLVLALRAGCHLSRALEVVALRHHCVQKQPACVGRVSGTPVTAPSTPQAACKPLPVTANSRP